jgi:glycine betaine/proline transport system substrate-binding protein
MIKKSLTNLAIAATLATAGTAAFADCGDVQIAEMNWASAELMANVDKIILENGYGCNVELVPGATMTSFASMNEKGQPDVAPELWINAVREPLNAAMGEGRLHSTNDGPNHTAW